MRFTTRVLGALLCTVALPSLSQAGMIVDSGPPIVYAGEFATPGQLIQITATGEIKMAEGFGQGPYDTDPDGKILDLVPLSDVSNVHNYMLVETGGLPVEVGEIVNISSRWTNELGQIVGSPFGGLMAGFSSTLTPTSLSDFVNGFTFIGSSGSITTPVGAPYLFLSINDTDRRDNIGSYDVTISEASSVPEPSSLVLTALGMATGCVVRRRQRKPQSSGCV